MKLPDLVKEIKECNTKFIVITGGVCSSIGKGVLVSSLGVLLKSAGYSVSVVKWDPYLNVDPGTMSPLEHGEVFVTADGAETDLDLGHYERTLGVSLMRDSSVSAGQIFKEILEGERSGKFLGRCIQLVPHVVNAIKERMMTFALNHEVDFVLIEIGGTVGDMEGQVFLEAIRQARMDLGPKKILHGHLSYVPSLEWTGDIKTKPTQHSVMALTEVGLVPDCLFLRADKAVPVKALEKLSIMCGVSRDFLFNVITCHPLYGLFLDLEKQGVGQRIQDFFGLIPKKSDLSAWEKLLERIKQCKKNIKIGIVAKYVSNSDPYMSVVEAIKSASYAVGCKVDIIIIDAEKLEVPQEPAGAECWQKLKSVDGIIGPGGFDKRGCEGKIAAVKWAREHNVPYLGLCLGLQMMLVEFARSLAGFKGANTTEFEKVTQYPIISLLEEQQQVTQKGGSMRLGASECTLIPGTKAYEAYQQKTVLERHRHRYEFNNTYKEAFEKVGVVFSGVYEAKNLVEIAELKGHPFMLGVQFHPEFLSLPLKPHPLFKAFVEAIVNIKQAKE